MYSGIGLIVQGIVPIAIGKKFPRAGYTKKLIVVYKTILLAS
jgi:hypothetical protein